MVKIKHEDFNKLSQLDRIEFRQKLDKCESNLGIIHIVYYCLILSSVFMVGGFIDIATQLLTLTVYAMVIHILLLVASSLITSSRTNKLVEEYFKIDIKKRGRQ